MAIWAHLILLPLLYLADGKPKPPGGASKKNITDISEESSNATDSEIYHFDYNLFKNKSHSKFPPHRQGRRIIRENFVLDQIEVKFDWNKIQLKERLGTLFQLKDEDAEGEGFVENALLYPPNDEWLVVRELKEGRIYSGEIRLIRDREALDDLNKTKLDDRFTFLFHSPRIIPEDELEKTLDSISTIPTTKVKLDSTSINFKLPSLKEHTVLELVDINDKNGSSSLVVQMSPKTVSLVVNDIPSSVVLRVTLTTGGNVTHRALVFTGAILNQPLVKTFFPLDSGGERLTVKCFVKDKPPFQGFPCKGSNICIPLHWECDGEEDCLGGYDERRCDGKAPSTKKCKRSEFSCISREVEVCLPVGWLCDGRTDCSDGWDERKENCRRGVTNSTSYTYCDRSHFKCHRGGCVVNHRVCDGYKDCSDGSDEYDCPNIEDEDDDDDDDDVDVNCDSKFEFSCEKGKCIPKPWLCDDQDDCPLGDDEDEGYCRSHNYFDRHSSR